MADIFTSVSARRVFPLIALGGMAGAVVGPLVTTLLVRLLGVAPLLMVSASMLTASLIVLLRLSMQHEQQHTESGGSEPIGGSLWAGIKELWSRPFLRYMAILMLFSDGIGTLAYALVADYAKAHFSDTTVRTAFYGHIDLAVNTLGALLQLTLTRWLLMRHGAAWGLVWPAVINTALLLLVVLGISGIVQVGFSVPLHLPDSLAALFGHSVVELGFILSAPLAVLLVITRGFAYGMVKPATDALYTRVPRETRYKGKNFIETAVWRFGDLVVTSGVSGLAKLGMGVAGMAAIGAGVSAVSIWLAHRAGLSPDLLPEQAPEDSSAEAAGTR